MVIDSIQWMVKILDIDDRTLEFSGMQPQCEKNTMYGTFIAVLFRKGKDIVLEQIPLKKNYEVMH